MILSFIKFTIVTPLPFLRDVASTHLVSFSIAFKIHMCPPGRGLLRPVTSKAYIWKPGVDKLLSPTAVAWIL